MIKIIEVSVNVFESFVIWYFIQKMLEQKYNKITHLITSVVFIVFFSIVVTIINQITLIETYSGIFYFLLCGIYSVICYKEKMSKKIFYSAIPLCVIVLSNIITLTIIPLVHNTNITEAITSTNIIRISTLIFAKVLQVAITIILVAILKKNTSLLSAFQWIGFLIIFVTTSFCGVFVLTIRITDDELLKTELYILTVIGLILINLFSFIFYINFARKSKENLEYKLNETKIAEQIKNAEEIETTYKNMRELKHDIVNQYAVVGRLISDKKYDEAEKYMSELTGYAENELNNSYLIHTKNESLNALINLYISRCSKLQIPLNCEISDVDLMEISNYDLASVISNLMNNALESSENTQNSQIEIQVFCKMNYVIISVSNTISASVLYSNKDLSTTKSDKQNHGFGIKSVKKIVKKYNGMNTFSENGNIFTAQVWLKRSNIDK